jgi:peptide/nickel transport system substrate-binding protein
MYRVTKLRWRRKVRQRKQQVESLGTTAEDQFDKHFIRRIVRLAMVRRFVGAWLLTIILLCGIVIAQTRGLTTYYQSLQPIGGGIYTEGIVGSLTNANPLFTSSMVDASVSRLVFAGLLRYDERNQLTGDLAQAWKLDDKGTTYSVTLRPDLKWHDGKPLTADDVVFTFQAAQNPDVKSSLFQAWREVTIKKVDDRTVTFTLRTPFAPFIYSLTSGIVPRHLLSEVEPSQLRSISFNTNHPIGAGPFTWQTLEISGSTPETREQSIGLSASESYHLGKPKLDRFVIKTYLSKERLNEAFQDRTVDGMVGVESAPEDESNSVKTYEAPLTAIQMAFFLTSDQGGSPILKDAKVRTALVQAANVPDIIKDLGYPVIRADAPFLRSSFAYDPALKQAGYDAVVAGKLLDEAGWTKGPNGQRKQGETELLIRMRAVNSADNKLIAKKLQQNWTELGIKVDVVLQNEEDNKATVESRSYDVLLSGISLGLDPDAYAFWHSSQADPRSPGRLNFSNYTSQTADKALDDGRTRVDPALRNAKYKPFLQAWKNDNPALALYQPRFLYVTRGTVFGYEPKSLNNSTDRLNNVHNWMIRQANVPIAN